MAESPQADNMLHRLGLYAKLLRLHKPIGIFLLLWPTLWALWMAGEGRVDFKVLIIFVAGVVLMRSAGCAINDFADRHIDMHVTRTKDRPLTSGQIEPREAVALFVILCLIAFGLVLMLNWLTVQLAVVAVILAGVYPFMKRFTYFPQVFLGATFAWATPMAYAAQSGELHIVTWLLYLATVLWTVAYDTMYAMADREDDIKIGVKSTAILFGDADRIMIGLLQVTYLAILLGLGVKADLGWFYYLGLLVAAGLSVYQQYLIYHRQPENCLKAFLNNNYVGLAVFAGIVAHFQWG